MKTVWTLNTGNVQMYLAALFQCDIDKKYMEA